MPRFGLVSWPLTLRFWRIGHEGATSWLIRIGIWRFGQARRGNLIQIASANV